MAAREHAGVEGRYGWKDQCRCQARTPKPFCFACKDTRDYENVVELRISVSFVIG
jgi:hypothetical protein